jgi:hypothetical protein
MSKRVKEYKGHYSDSLVGHKAALLAARETGPRYVGIESEARGGVSPLVFWDFFGTRPPRGQGRSGAVAHFCRFPQEAGQRAIPSLLQVFSSSVFRTSSTVEDTHLSY